MSLKRISLFLVLLLLPLNALGETVDANVPGMTCSYCSQKITKELKENEAIEEVKVTLDDKKVAIKFKEGKSLSDDEVKNIIKKAGYDVKGIERGR